MDIANGDIIQNAKFFITDPKSEQKELAATITFKIQLEEIWDFHLTFNDFKATNLVNKFSPESKVDPSVMLEL